MKKLLTLLALGMATNSFASDALMECHASATDKKGNVVFEIQATIYDVRVSSQGMTLTDYSGKKPKIVSLTVSSTDHFQDNYTVSIHATSGKKIIGDMTSPARSLRTGTNSFAMATNVYNNDMQLVCNRLN